MVKLEIREAIDEALRTGNFVSQADLAKKHNTSRNFVFLRVKALKKEGVLIKKTSTRPNDPKRIDTGKSGGSSEVRAIPCDVYNRDIRRAIENKRIKEEAECKEVWD